MRKKIFVTDPLPGHAEPDFLIPSKPSRTKLFFYNNAFCFVNDNKILKIYIWLKMASSAKLKQKRRKKRDQKRRKRKQNIKLIDNFYKKYPLASIRDAAHFRTSCCRKNFEW